MKRGKILKYFCVLLFSFYFAKKSDGSIISDVRDLSRVENSKHSAKRSVLGGIGTLEYTLQGIDGCLPDYHYQCPNSNPYVTASNCLNIHSLCDGIYDCLDGKDEEQDFCLTTCRNTSGWWCEAGQRCMHRLTLCDQEKTCKGKPHDEKKGVCKVIPCPWSKGWIMCKKTYQCVRWEDYCADTNICPNGIAKTTEDEESHPSTSTGEVCDDKCITGAGGNRCKNGATCIGTIGSYICICTPGFTGDQCDAEMNACDTLEPCIHGICSIDGNGYLCICDDGYEGPNCEINVACDPNPCSNGASCSESTAGFLCSCTAGWMGQYCDEPIDSCSSHHCDQGTCNDHQYFYTCTCNSGFSGQLCNLSVCDQAGISCLNEGVCIPSTSADGDPWTCQCGSDYTGMYCQNYMGCDSNPCNNGGSCSEGLGGFVCSCATGWTGQHCDEPVSACINHHCDHGICNDHQYSYSCTCQRGYTGQYCNVSVCDEAGVICLNDGLCVASSAMEGDPWTCQCGSQHAGIYCQDNVACNSNPCSNGGICRVSDNGFSCACAMGWSGMQCDEPINACNDHRCDHGSCIDHQQFYSCTCQRGYTGRFCNLSVCDELGIVCLNGGVCVASTSMDGDSWTCQCEAGHTGMYCQENVACNSNPCGNGGICNALDSGFSCTCAVGWSGLQCDEPINACNDHGCDHGSCNDHQHFYSCTCQRGYMGQYCNLSVCDELEIVCLNGGVCVASTLMNGDSWTCQCEAGHSGRYCQENVACNSNPCSNGGICSASENGFSCACAVGWTGLQCDEPINACNDHRCDHGSCDDHQHFYSCTCQRGFTGQYCNLSVCDELGIVCLNGGVCVASTLMEGDSWTCQCGSDNAGMYCQENVACDSYPCNNGGSCNASPNGFACTCAMGWTGQYCDEPINACNNHYCDHGNCNDHQYSYSCICQSGYIGQYCNMSVCDEAGITCLNGGVCMANTAMEGDPWTCGCRSNYTGMYCQENLACDSSPCSNGGSCFAADDRFVCVCTTGWTGQQCDEPINACINHLCDHGICIDHQYSYSCSCQTGYTGQYCNLTICDVAGISCLHGGACVPSTSMDGDPWTCQCGSDYAGMYCQEYQNGCSELTCENDGHCVDTAEGPVCVCTREWSGNRCQYDTDECAEGSFLCDAGSCINTEGGYNCVCDDGYHGVYCTHHICDFNLCMNGGTCRYSATESTGYECDCMTDFTGFNCQDELSVESTAATTVTPSPQCVITDIWAEWLEFSACKLSYGSCQRMRTRSCIYEPCIGLSQEYRRCDRYECSEGARTCQDLSAIGYVEDGIYWLDPDGQGSFYVYCELNPNRTDGTTGPGWTVFQRRVDDTVDFYRNWVDYEAGFGDIVGNYWMGLEKLHRLTSLGTVQLSVYLETFDNDSAYATYDVFGVADSSDNYRLQVSGYSGTAGDSLSGHSSYQFSTKDRDNDDHSGNCAIAYSGAWWYSSCHSSNLNGQYLAGAHSSYADGINWYPYQGHYYSLKTTVLKIRPILETVIDGPVEADITSSPSCLTTDVWSEWSEFDDCQMTYDSCQKLRTRTCLCSPCSGHSKEYRSCDAQECTGMARNCNDLSQLGFMDDGIYTLDPDNHGSFSVYCELNPERTDGTTGAGWTVFQRRVDDTVDFYRNWAEYEAGFGDIDGNYWMGLRKLHRLTSLGTVQLSVYFETFDNDSAYATYDVFGVADSSDNYRLQVSGYSGTAGDSLSGHSSYQFSTNDRDNDDHSGNCAIAYSGAWWYSSCHSSNLNGRYLAGVHSSYADGINWYAYQGHYYSLKTTVMKIRPVLEPATESPEGDAITSSPSCATTDVWSEWSEFDDCKMTYDSCQKLRTRTCLCSPCSGHSKQYRSCEAQECIDSVRSCKHLSELGYVDDGIYTLDPDGNGSFDVYCDLNPERTDGTTEAGWTVFQRRVDDTVDFYRNWADYEAGFGDIDGNYWMGLANLYRLTSSGSMQLHVYLETFEDDWAYALYHNFGIAGSSDNYRLQICGYSGTAGNALSGHDNYQFSTKDRDNDESSSSCAITYSGAWWYSRCHIANLNGKYLGGEHSSYADGVNWYPYKGHYYSLKTTIMKIRPL